MTTETATLESLERVRNFDATTLEQASRLGETYMFSDVVEPANKLISLFQKIPEEALKELPENQLKVIFDQANNIYNLFDQVLTFDAGMTDAVQKRDSLSGQISGQYQKVFTQLHPLISYSMARTVDFNSLSEQGRVTIQGIKDETNKLLSLLEEQKAQAESILDEVRDKAGELGVTNQAEYFASEARSHKGAADKWKVATWWVGGAVGVYAASSFFLHKVPFLAPSSLPESIQFTASKLLLFFVLTYILFLCARNFLSHRHNEIVNKHRQNALMTYRSLVEAGFSPEARDVVLNHAASSIYRLHDTGYIRNTSRDGSSNTSIVELLPRATLPLKSDG